MEMNKQSLKIRKKCMEEKVQITLDDDFNVPDLKPDVEKIIYKDGKIEVLELNVINGKILCKGNLVFTLLYQCLGDAVPLQSIQGKLAFDEMLQVPVLMEEEKVDVNWQIEDLTVQMINSRKISVKALVTCGCKGWKETELYITVGMGNAQKMPSRYKEMQVLTYEICKKDSLRFHENFRLPTVMPNIERILFQNVQIADLEWKEQVGQITMEGLMDIFVVYKTYEDSHMYVYQAQQKIQGSMPCENCREDSILQMRTELLAKDVQVKQNEDGEERNLEVELVIGGNFVLYAEKNISCLVDAYGLQKKLQLTKEEIVYPKRVLQEKRNIRLEEQVKIDESIPELAVIAHVTGKMLLDGVETQKGESQVYGSLEVTVLYQDQQEENKWGQWRILLPFQQTITGNGASKENLDWEISCQLQQINVAIVGKNTLEVKGNVSMVVLLQEEVSCNLVSEIEEMQEKEEKWAHLPDLVGYVVQEEDSLWELAKRYHTTEQAIQERNQKRNKELVKGEKLLIAVGEE